MPPKSNALLERKKPQPVQKKPSANALPMQQVHDRRDQSAHRTGQRCAVTGPSYQNPGRRRRRFATGSNRVRALQPRVDDAHGVCRFVCLVN
jgi:hypothetical protein